MNCKEIFAYIQMNYLSMVQVIIFYRTIYFLEGNIDKNYKLVLKNILIRLFTGAQTYVRLKMGELIHP